MLVLVEKIHHDSVMILVDLFYEKVVNFDFLVTGTVEERPELLVGA
jgi:hypothetical protein